MRKKLPQHKVKLYGIELDNPRATFGVVVFLGKVVDVAPIGKYTLGWSEARLKRYFLKRGALVYRIGRGGW